MLMRINSLINKLDLKSCLPSITKTVSLGLKDDVSYFVFYFLIKEQKNKYLFRHLAVIRLIFKRFLKMLRVYPFN